MQSQAEGGSFSDPAGCSITSAAGNAASPMNASIVFAITALLVLALGFRRTRDSERLLVLRLGRVHRLAGPGITWHLPAIDRPVRVDLDTAVPDWRSLTEDQLISRLIEYVSQPAPGAS